MAFSISFLDEPIVREYNHETHEWESGAMGLLVLGDWKESFLSTLFEWNKQDYEAQWLHAIRKLLNGKTKVPLIVEYIDPSRASKLIWWPMYRVEDTVYIQNHILWYEQLAEPFSIGNAGLSLRDRQTHSEDGQLISEWSVSLAEIEKFANERSI